MDRALEIYCLCQCNNYSFDALRMRLEQEYEVFVFRNVLQLRFHHGEIVIFNYGVVVFWNINKEERAKHLLILVEFMQGPLAGLQDDDFTYSLNESNSSIKDDHIFLSNHDVMTRLAISHGIAQSTKLGQYEALIQNTITSTENIPRNIANNGKSGLRRKELAKLRGFLFLTKSNVMLNYDLLDIPELFWQYPELQSYYSMVADYLEINPRVEVLNKKLETIQDLLEMISDEQKHSHSAVLEWIIIWLIALEIIVLLIQEYVLK